MIMIENDNDVYDVYNDDDGDAAWLGSIAPR